MRKPALQWVSHAAMWAASRLPWSWQEAAYKAGGGFDPTDENDVWAMHGFLASRRDRADRFFSLGLKGSWGLAKQSAEYVEYLAELEETETDHYYEWRP